MHVHMYRVTLVVEYLGWVDYDFGHSTFCPVPLGHMGIWQIWLYSWVRWWNVEHFKF